MEGGAPASGWTLYPPLVLQTGKALPFAIFSVHLLGISSIMGAINIIATIFNMRAPGMTLMKMPLFVWDLADYCFFIDSCNACICWCGDYVVNRQVFLKLAFFDAAGGGDPVSLSTYFLVFSVIRKSIS